MRGQNSVHWDHNKFEAENGRTRWQEAWREIYFRPPAGQAEILPKIQKSVGGLERGGPDQKAEKIREINANWKIKEN